MRHLGMLALTGLLAGGMATGIALAQKPPASDAPPSAGKPAPAPAPAPGPSGKLAPSTPAPPSAPPAVPAPAPAPGPSGKLAPSTPAPQATIPANEPAAIGRLRRLLGPDTTLVYDNAEVTDPARGTVRLSGVTLTAHGKPTRIESLTLDDLRDDGLGEAVARNLTQQDGTTSISLERAQIAGLTVRAPAPGEPRRPDLVTLDALRLEGLRVQDGDKSDIRIAQAALEDYGSGRQSRASLSGLEMRLKPGEAVDQLRLARVVLRGLDLARLATAAASDQPPPLAGRMAFEMEELTASNGGRAVGSLASLRLSSDQPESGTGTGTLALRALRIEPLPGLGSWMQRLGYPFLLFDVTADSRYDPTGGRLDLTTFSLAGRDMGTLALAMVLEGVSIGAMQRQDTSQVRLAGAALRYIDQSLFGRVLAQQAREGGMSEAQLREQYANMIAGALAAPALTPVREAVQRFIRGQAHEVELTLRPPRPVPLDELRRNPPTNPAEAAQRFGLGATAR
jgi:hypothetical protein